MNLTFDLIPGVLHFNIVKASSFIRLDLSNWYLPTK
jgi:hypothetical protein